MGQGELLHVSGRETHSNGSLKEIAMNYYHDGMTFYLRMETTPPPYFKVVGRLGEYHGRFSTLQEAREFAQELGQPVRILPVPLFRVGNPDDLLDPIVYVHRRIHRKDGYSPFYFRVRTVHITERGTFVIFKTFRYLEESLLNRTGNRTLLQRLQRIRVKYTISSERKILNLLAEIATDRKHLYKRYLSMLRLRRQPRALLRRIQKRLIRAQEEVYHSDYDGDEPPSPFTLIDISHNGVSRTKFVKKILEWAISKGGKNHE